MRAAHEPLFSTVADTRPLTKWSQQCQAKRARLAAAGVNLDDPERCACGNKALWKWKDKGYCRRCKPAKVAK